MKKYYMKLIATLIICMFVLQPAKAWDGDGLWDDDRLDDWYEMWDDYWDDYWGNDKEEDDWWRRDDGWDNVDNSSFEEDERDTDNNNNNNNNNNNYYNNTTTLTEHQFGLEHPIAAAKFYANANKASEVSLNRYPGSQHNGAGDAFRHAFWSALNVVSENVNLARQMGTAHENGAPNQPQVERTMDLHNNEVGYSIGSDAKENGWNETQIINEVVAALEDGRLVTLY